MKAFTPFDCVSPLDFRYYLLQEDLFERLSPFVSESARVAYELKVEAAVARALARRGVCSSQVAEEIEAACAQVTPEEVAEEEGRIKHNLRALVNCIRRRVSDSAKPFVHFTLTSFDVIDTATALRMREAAEQVLLPDLLELERNLISLTRREKDTPQIGRTHGQYAVPLTFGFALAEYVSRLGNRLELLRAAARNLRGKISGAVGAYNASALLFSDPETFEREVLAQLGLQPSTHSTQIVEAEYMADFVHDLLTTFGVLANLADDLRHLQRSEIAEVGEAFAPEQVGSSTMPHKRNPETFEHVKSMWKAFAPRIVTTYADQISEHQRDLTNSASQRFVPEMVVALAACVRRLNLVLPRLLVDHDSMRLHLRRAAPLVVAEPLYILLAAVGHPDAHEAVRLLTEKALQTGQGLMEVAREEPSLRPYLERLTPQQKEVLEDPVRYRGIAAQKAESVCLYWSERLKLA